MVSIVISLILCFLTHEGGHFLAALCFGHRIRFRFAWGQFYVPRYIWYMPRMERWKQRIVAAAGFGTELTISLILGDMGFHPMLLCACAHLLAYPFYSGTASDFKWF